MPSWSASQEPTRELTHEGEAEIQGASAGTPSWSAGPEGESKGKDDDGAPEAAPGTELYLKAMRKAMRFLSKPPSSAPEKQWKVWKQRLMTQLYRISHSYGALPDGLKSALLRIFKDQEKCVQNFKIKRENMRKESARSQQSVVRGQRKTEKDGGYDGQPHEPANTRATDRQ